MIEVYLWGKNDKEALPTRSGELVDLKICQQNVD